LFVFRPAFQPDAVAAAVLGVYPSIPVRFQETGQVSTFFRLSAQRAAADVLTSLHGENQYFHTRGLLLLIQGQWDEARKRFLQASTPQGVNDLPMPWTALDEQLVSMLDAAAKPRGDK
jgi:hypothetical protein